HEAHSRSGQRGARGDRRRGRALPGTGGAAARRCRARRVVSLSEGGGPHAARLPTVLRALQRTDDTARVGVDRGYARGPCDAHRREHPADRARGAPAEPDSLTGLPLLALFIFRSSRPAGPQPRDGLRLALPFFYGWVIVAVGFVTMAIGVRARAHGVLAPVPAGPGRVRLGARRDGRRVLLRLLRLGTAQPARRAADGSPRAAHRDRDGRDRDGGGAHAGSLRTPALASLRDARRARGRRRELPRVHGPVALPPELVRAPSWSGREPHLLWRRRRLDRGATLAPLAHP